jgi:hypothetical protein
MSNAFAIAAVTATLYNLLKAAAQNDSEFQGVTVTTKPPDVARDGDSGDQLNIFLYHTTTNSAFSNIPMRERVKPNEKGRPPLALNLHYLITAYGNGDDDVRAHLLLGLAMLALHDYSQLTRDDLKNVLSTLKGMRPDLHEQIEQVKITPQPLSLEELSKLWTTFQTQYRISAAYSVSVVVIESKDPVVTPLPVARRTADDYVDSQSNLLPPFPTLTDVLLAKDVIPEIDKKTPAQVRTQLAGIDQRDIKRALSNSIRRTTFVPHDHILLIGHHLTGKLELQFEHPRLPQAIPLSIDNRAANGGKDFFIPFILPDRPNAWLPGVYRLRISVNDSDPPRTSNVLPFVIAPTMTVDQAIERDAEGFPSVPLPAGGSLTLAISVNPGLLHESQVVLLFNKLEVKPEPDTTIPPVPRRSKLQFALSNLQAKRVYPLRLRVDGVDSLLIDVDQTPPSFRPDQHLKVT